MHFKEHGVLLFSPKKGRGTWKAMLKCIYLHTRQYIFFMRTVFFKELLSNEYV